MKTIRNAITCVCFFSIFCPTAWATHIYLEPMDPTINIGDQISVDLKISGLGAYNLWGFDMLIEFDESVLNFMSYSLSDDLFAYGIDDIFNDQSIGYLGTGTSLIHLSGYSEMPEFSWQPDQFSIATLTFTGRALGRGVVGLWDVDYIDLISLNFGTLDYIFDSTANNSYITVSAPLPPSNVPEPGTLILLGFGILFCTGMNRKKF